MATIFNNISPDGENRRLMLIDAWAEDPLTVEMMDHPVNGDKVAVRSHNSLNEIVVDSVKVYDNGSWVDEGGGGGEMQTATVTVSSPGDPLAVACTRVIGDAIVASPSIENGEYTVPLGANGCVWALREEATVAVTGDIVFDSEEGDITITGDGTITFS